jgi:hypothetical protein
MTHRTNGAKYDLLYNSSSCMVYCCACIVRRAASIAESSNVPLAIYSFIGVIHLGSFVSTECTSWQVSVRFFITSVGTCFVKWAKAGDASLPNAPTFLFWLLGICAMLNSSKFRMSSLTFSTYLCNVSSLTSKSPLT